MSTTSGASTGIIDLSENLHLYLCQSLYPRHINNLARTCKQLHHRLNPELWKLGTATPDGKDEILYHAALTGDLALLQKLTDEYKLDFDRLNMQRAIRNAAKGSHESVITYLLSIFGKYGDATDLDLSESLILAAKNGNARIAQLLLDHGVSIRDKARALRTAADNTHAGVVDVLLNKQNPDIAGIISASDSSVVTCALDPRVLRLTGSELSADAIRAKVEPTIAILLNHGFDLESNTEFGLTPLMCAVYKGYLWAVEMLLSHGASTTVKCPRRSTVLHYAVGLPDKEQRIEIVQLLLQYGADITCKNKNGTTPLSLAAECQRLDYLRLMVPSLSTLSTLDEHKDKFLCLAARKGDVDWVSELIRLGADVNKIQSIERHIRAHRSGIDVLAEKAKLAQRKSTDQDPEDKTWESLTYHCLPTALHHAAFENRIGTMEILVSQGAIVDSFPESSLLTPLHVALARGHMAAARWLLDKGADLNRMSNQQHWWSYMDSLKSTKWTSLHFAAIGGRETFEFAKSQGITISWEDKTIASLWESAAGGRDRANEDFMLLVYGSCCDSETGEYLDRMYPDESLHLNINRGLDMDKIFHTIHDFPYLNIGGKDKMGQTLLHHAARSGNVPAIEYLLRRGHPIDAKDDHSQTALLYAAKSCKADAVRILLEHGAHLDSREGGNALKIIKACLLDYEPKVSKSAISMRATLQELMKRGVHLNLMYMGSGFLHDVATAKYLQYQEEALITMLDWGADLDAIDEHGMTPLHYAIQFKDSRIMALLLQYDTSLAVKNREGKTPVQLAEDAIFHPVKNKEGKTTLQLAEDDLVFGLRASLDMKNKEGKCPLQLAEDSAQQKIVDLLMRKAAGLKIEFVPRDTPPDYSSWRGLL